MSTARRAAEKYIRNGLAPIPIPAGSKNPNRQSWQNERWTLEDIPRLWNDRQNVGILNGEPSGWIVTVDLDVPEALKVAGRFLTPTLTSGREGTPHAHWWYKCVGATTEKWKDLDGSMLLELRSTGCQTVVAPSVHPEGDRYLWHEGLETAENSAGTLAGACRELAAATLVARHLPPVGGRHDFALALVGYLLRRLDPKTVQRIVLAAWDAAGGDGQDAHRDLEGIVRDTAEKLSTGAPASGGSRLEELAAGVPRLLARWWGWGRGTDNGSSPAPVPHADGDDGNNSEKKRNQADRLIDYARVSGAELFEDQSGSPHALIDGEAVPLNTGAYKWLRTLMWDLEGISVGGEALKTAAGTLAAFASRDGRVRELHTRSAFHEGAVYYRLDKGRVVRIDRDGWQKDEDPPVVFRTVPNLKPLPDPEEGGTLDQLEELVNLKTDRDRRLLKVYAATVALPHVARPILQATGVMGSGKTTASRVIKRAFDPTAPETVRIDPRDFLQKASHSYIVMLDNQNSLPEWAVDTLCRLVTGEGDSKRSLYTDDEDFIYEMRRAILLNGISTPTDRGDAQDRTLPVELDRIPDRERRSEEELWEAFDDGHGRLLGAAFDALAGAIRARETLNLYKKPRLADWGEYAAGVYEALGWGPDLFLEDWDGVVRTQNQDTLDGSPVAQAIGVFMANHSEYEGVASDLHKKLQLIAEELNIDVKRDKAWPKTPTWLWRRVKEVLPLLAAMGVIATKRDGKTGSIIALKKDPLGPPDGGSNSEKCFHRSPDTSTLLPPEEAHTYEDGGSSGGSGSRHGHSSMSLSRTQEGKSIEKGREPPTSRKVPADASTASNAAPNNADSESSCGVGAPGSTVGARGAPTETHGPECPCGWCSDEIEVEL